MYIYIYIYVITLCNILYSGREPVIDVMTHAVALRVVWDTPWHKLALYVYTVTSHEMIHYTVCVYKRYSVDYDSGSFLGEQTPYIIVTRVHIIGQILCDKLTL